MNSPLGEISITIFLGVLFAYLFDRLGFPPFLGFFLAGAIVGKLGAVNLPDVYLQILLSLVAFEVGRGLGISGLSPAAFFAVILESALIISLSMLLFKLIGLTLTEVLIIAIMMLSSSSILVNRFAQVLPTEARAIALSITTLEDAVLFFAISLLFGKTTIENLPVNIVVVTAVSVVALAVFRYVYRLIIGREYAIPFALAIAFGFVYVVQYFQIASPFLGAFIGGYIFSRADTHGVHIKEATALSSLIIYLYMLVVGFSIPMPAVNPLFIALSLATALLAVFVRVTAVFLSALFTTGQPRFSINVATATAHISELSITIPIVAYRLGVLKNAELAFALSTTPILTLFLAPLFWRQRSLLEKYVAKRIRELKIAVAYEKLYKVVTHFFITTAKLVVLTLVIAIVVSYLGIFSLVLLIPTIYYLIKYSRYVYIDLLLALREIEQARYVSIMVLVLTFALASYVVFALIVKVAELHHYIALLVVTVLTYLLIAIYKELSSNTTK